MTPNKKAITAIIITIIVITTSTALGHETPKKDSYHSDTHINVHTKDKVYIVSRTSSEVIISTKNSLKHYGNPIEHYAFQGFKPFTYNGTLMAIGGYGFWRINPFLLEFDTVTGWNPHNLGDLYKPTTNPYVHIAGDSLIVLGGTILDENLIDFHQCTKIQYVDLIKRKCISSINVDILKDASIIADEDGKVVLKNKAGYFLIQLKSMTIYKLNINTKNIHVFEKPKIEKATEDEIIINNISIAFTQINKPNKKPKFPQIILGIFGIILTLIFILIYRSSIRKATSSKKSTMLKNNTVNIEGKERELINLLITGPKLLNELFELYPSQLSQSHKTKLIREVISQINSKTNFRGENIILISNDEIDSRRKIIYLNDSINLDNFGNNDKVKY